MASYTVLRKGDVLPTVAVLQALLNRAGAALKVDCDFGRLTAEALAAFQQNRSIEEWGVVGAETWRRLSWGESLPIADCIDVFDQTLYERQAQVVVQTGSEPLFMGGMSNGLAQAAVDLASLRGVFLLRFIGHGCPGVQGLGIGKGGWIEYKDDKEIRHIFAGERSRLQPGTARGQGWIGLRGVFGPYASVELHGCHVAAGHTGRRFVSDLANLLNVPVTAAEESQHQAVRFDGPTFTGWPLGTSRSSWCQGLPAPPGRSVP